jgi:hypothetical protein
VDLKAKPRSSAVQSWRQRQQQRQQQQQQQQQRLTDKVAEVVL